ncbi:MAG: phage tail tape measure protein, partial [Pseudomonadota bacterium]
MPSTAAIIIKAIDKATGPMRYIQQRYRAMDREQRRIVTDSVRGMGQAGKVLTGLSAGVAAVSLAFRAQTETALGGLASVGIKDLKALENAGRDFSNMWAVASKSEFLQAAYDIKSGISSLSDQGVADVTRLAGITAQATKATVGQMTSLFATAYGMYKGQFKNLSDTEFAQRFAAGLAATVQGFKTNGPAIQQAIESTKGALSAANVPLAEQLVLLGSLQATMKGSEAGTAAKAFALNVGKAGKALGLPFLNAQKQMRSLPEVLELLRKKYGDTLDAIEKQQIKEAFGSEEALSVIDALCGKEKNFRQELARTNQELAKGT